MQTMDKKGNSGSMTLSICFKITQKDSGNAGISLLICPALGLQFSMKTPYFFAFTEKRKKMRGKFVQAQVKGFSMFCLLLANISQH